MTGAVEHASTGNSSEALWNIDDVAAFTGVPKSTLYNWRTRDLGPPAFRLGKHLRFRPRDVRAWVEEHPA